MKIVIPIEMRLSPMQTLTILQGLCYIIEDEEAHELDREAAQKLKDEILMAVELQAEEVGEEWGAFLL